MISPYVQVRDIFPRGAMFFPRGSPADLVLWPISGWYRRSCAVLQAIHMVQGLHECGFSL